MFKPIFEGQEVILCEMLKSREQRSMLQKEWLERKSGTLISATLSIPGPIKNSEVLEKVFLTVINEFRKMRTISIMDSLYLSDKTGPVYFQLTDRRPIRLKRELIEIEENHPFGRLVDLDVLYMDGSLIKTMSRDTLNYPRRRCLICERDAKECGRERAHSMDDMQAKIVQIVREGENKLYEKKDSFYGNSLT